MTRVTCRLIWVKKVMVMRPGTKCATTSEQKAVQFSHLVKVLAISLVIKVDHCPTNKSVVTFTAANGPGSKRNIVGCLNCIMVAEPHSCTNLCAITYKSKIKTKNIKNTKNIKKIILFYYVYVKQHYVVTERRFWEISPANSQ